MRKDLVNLLNLGASLHVFEYNDAEYPFYNPSIAYDKDGKLMIAIRSCNFTLRPNGSWYLADGLGHAKTKVVYGELDPETYQIYDARELSYSDDTPSEIKDISGLEDARIFLRDGDMHFIGVEVDTRDKKTKPANIAEFVLRGNELKYLKTHSKPDQNRVEKNWGVTNKPALFDFNYSPTQIYKDGEVSGQPYHYEIHGGTQLIEQYDGTYLSVVHTRIQNELRLSYNRSKYISMFARYTKHGYMIQLSDPFHFGTGENIEFASGMVEKDGKLLISLGIRDSRFGLVKIPKWVAENMLKPYDLHNEIDNIYLPPHDQRVKFMAKRKYT